jgi:hypothetical protein
MMGGELGAATPPGNAPDSLAAFKIGRQFRQHASRPLWPG